MLGPPLCLHCGPMRKSAELKLRISPELKEVAREAAWRERRSLSGLIEYLLSSYCEAVGLQEPRRKKPTRRGK